jgi:hypothetical protein
MRMPYLLITILAFCSCHTGKGNLAQINPPEEKNKQEFFQEFISRINLVDLPFKHDMNGNETISSSFKFNNTGYDTLFLDAEHSQVIGMLPDTSQFIGVLYFLPGDDLVPSLITFDKNGNKIDDQILCSLACNGMPCEGYLCNSKMVLTKDLEILNYREMHINRCEGNQKDVSEISNQTGLIKKNGEIILNPVERKKWK